MIRVAVISDTHGSFRHLPAAVQALGQVDWLLHAGDHLRDAPRVAAALGVPAERVRAVVGNCCYPETEPAEVVAEIGGVKFLLVHGHKHGVKTGVERMHWAAQEAGARVAVFGHSHVPVNVDWGGVLLFNPGSLSQPRLPGDPPTCGLIEIGPDGSVRGEILPLR
jgi:putative phosphoesterase